MKMFLRSNVTVGTALLLVAFRGWAQPSEKPKEPNGRATKSFLWRAKGTNASVHLLGTLWSTQDPPPISARMEEAYATSSMIVVRYTNEEEMANRLHRQFEALGTYPSGETIRGHVTRSTYETLLAGFQGSTNEWQKHRPWFIGLNITTQELARHGFNGSNSIASYFVTKAKRDGKTVMSLERPDTMLNILSALPDVQAEWALLQAMEEAAYYSTNLNEIVETWKTGNVKRLDEINLTHLNHFPFLGRKITIERNEAWLPRIEKLLAGRTNALVIVYARHLVGRDSLLDLLELKGFKVEQL